VSSADSTPELPGPDAPTYWNGAPCQARQVVVTVADNPKVPLYWARPFPGTEREAVEVTYAGGTFYLDDEGYEQSQETRDYLEDSARSLTRSLHGGPEMLAEQRRRLGVDQTRVGGPGWGWAKVAIGMGSPRYGHASLEVEAGSVQDRW
jgi:hypothetical protein